MTDRLKKLLVAVLFAASASYAGSNDYTYDSSSLVAIEGGFTSMEVKNPSNLVTKDDFGTVGLKIGAQTRNVRMFVSFRNGFIDDDNYNYDYFYMYGAELQYLFNFSTSANFFIGASAGRISLRFDDATLNQRDYATNYTGGDLGFNIHMNENFDFELGARFINLLDSEHTLSGVKYTFDDITMGYMSIIFKYQMD
ncbi:porin family protein (plasmid) [Sulfurimonas lithotrophica]|uniref:Porin family protein n=1 Tax=Sulfurimonas lithotrophica TaxID=2590022 RepID=A0A5P8P2I7_9BACT|nr:outer membrane beta-barrel protein [Sulfurimonas lithotrophica]QFR49953.1 porin family protein [Sulfurimonas lithotrophica]QFR50516.1 porin family protein [Sulfurimonas lithotrophica]QFR50532.1 porin family protein [Sulfurimonas lithotrophica]